MAKEKKTKGQLLEEKLKRKTESAWKTGRKQEIMLFAREYKDFFSKCKTERDVAKFIVETAKKEGFVDLDTVKKYKAGLKVYSVFHNKSVILGVLGKKKPSKGLKIIASHLDSPRIDLKPNPIYEDQKLALLKTHYYGGIKKYQWVNIPLEIRGVIFKENGEKVDICIGSKKEDPVFVISDLLPHLGKDQLKKEGKKVVEGEELNVLIGNVPFEDENVAEQVKLNILKILNNTYGLKEEDFVSAELEIVPALEPKDIGFDRSMVGAYGQDDRAHVFASLKAILMSKPEYTSLACFFDKEEIGSETNTGAQSAFLEIFVSKLLDLESDKVNYSKLYDLFKKSEALSADVDAALNPTYADVQDLKNVPRLGNGVCLTKYTGSGGKYDSNDAHAEFVSKIRNLLNKNNIPWQTGELGKVDQGGGGTIAMYLARRGMNVVDFGVSVLGMHSPYEISSKADIYYAFRAFVAFFNLKN